MAQHRVDAAPNDPQLPARRSPQPERERQRQHVNMGPRVHDMELKDVVDVVLKARAGAYSFELRLEAISQRHDRLPREI